MDQLDTEVVEKFLDFVYHKKDRQSCRLVCQEWRRLLDDQIKIMKLTSRDQCRERADLSHRWPSVTKIEVTVPSSDSMSHLPPLFGVFESAQWKVKEVEAVNIRLTRHEARELVKLAAGNWSELRSLTLRCPSYWEPAAIDILIGVHWPHLEELELDLRAYEGGHGLINLPELLLQCPNLKKLATPFVAATANLIAKIAATAANLPLLEHLDISKNECGPSLGGIFARNASFFSRLKYLNLAGTKLGSAGLIDLTSADFSALEELDVGARQSLQPVRYSQEALTSLRQAMMTKWPLKRLAIPMLNNANDVVLLLDGNLAKVETIDWMPRILGISDELIVQAFADAAQRGRLPCYKTLPLRIHHNNIVAVRRLFSSPWPGLKELDLEIRDVPSLQPSLMEALSRGHFPVLATLKLRMRRRMDPGHLQSLFSHPWPNVRTLTISRDGDLEGFQLSELAKMASNLPKIRQLGLSGLRNFHYDSLRTLFNAQWKSLKEIFDTNGGQSGMIGSEQVIDNLSSGKFTLFVSPLYGTYTRYLRTDVRHRYRITGPSLSAGIEFY